MLTILVSYAQEESRSVSENCKWRIRKDFKEGIPSNNIRIFCYDYKAGKLTVIPEEAEIVRMIFADYLSGLGRNAIMKKLTRLGAPTKLGGRWAESTVNSIHINEKYIGDMCLQKTYCADFLTKKMVKNDGRIQQFYVEDSHPAIIAPDEFDAVQLEIERGKSRGRPTSCTSIFAARIVCADCGGWFGKKVWGSYKDDKAHRKEIWQCNDKYKHRGKLGKGCQTPHITEDDIKAHFLTAFNSLMGDRDGLIEDCRLAQSVLYDTSAIDAELADLYRGIEVITELSRKAIYENARTTVNQREWGERNNGYLVRDIEKSQLAITEFDDKLWLAVIDQVKVCRDGSMTFRFRNGSMVRA